MKLTLLNEIAPLSPEMKVGEIQLLFAESNFSHYPIVEDEHYLGSLASYVIRDIEPEKLVSDLAYEYERFFVFEDRNELELIEVVSKHQANIMPVLSLEENKYLGYVELHDVLDFFGNMPFLNEHGNIIVVAKGVVDQSFSEICQIVESNNVKVLSVYVSSIEKDVVESTLKIGDGDFNAVIQTFRRYGYEIISDHYDDVFLNSLRERSRYFDKYLSM